MQHAESEQIAFIVGAHRLAKLAEHELTPDVLQEAQRHLAGLQHSVDRLLKVVTH